jgi:outer membrane protein
LAAALAAAFGLGLTGATAAQTTPAPAGSNDLSAIYRDALANDPTYAAARASQLASIERTPQARAALLPQINASAGYSRTRQNVDPPDVTRTFSGWGPTLTLTQPLFRAQSWVALDQAKLSVAQAEAILAQARQDLVLRVTQAYFDVLAAEDQLVAIGANKKAVSEQLAQARREFEVGTKTIVDTHEAQARFDQIVAQEQVARGDAIVKRNALRAITGRDPGTLAPLRERPALATPEPADVETWAKRAEESSSGVSIARATADIAQLETSRARRGHWPTLDLSASVSDSRSNGSATTTGDLTTRSSTIGVQLTVPIYSGGLTQSQVRESLALEEKARQDLETARRNAAQGARQAYTGTDFGLSQVRALESAEVSAKSQLDSTRLGYQVGVRINLDVLNATTQLFNTQRDLKKARYDFLVNGLRLKSAVGALDDPDVQAINALLMR